MSILKTFAYRRSRAIKRCFLDDGGQLTPHGKAALEYLAGFCHANRSTMIVSPVTRTVDTHATMLAEGRREVFTQITHYLNLDEHQIQALQESPNED